MANSFEEQGKNDSRNSFFDMRDRHKNGASELERNIVSVQSAKYETSLYRLMQHSVDDVELVNALNEFLTALDARSLYGNSEEPLSKEHREKPVTFFEKSARELQDLMLK